LASKAIEFGEKKRKIRAITPFKVIQELSPLIVQILDIAFLTPLGSLGTTYDVHLGLIGNRVVDFPLVLVELFS